MQPNARQMLLLCWSVFGFVSVGLQGAEPSIVNLTGSYSAIVTVRNADGSAAGGKQFKLSYMTPSDREVVLNKGTELQSNFTFEPMKLIAILSSGTIPTDGRIQFNNLAGAPRTFSLSVEDDGF